MVQFAVARVSRPVFLNSRTGRSGHNYFASNPRKASGEFTGA
jgi:hypothetical protein